MTRGRSPRTRSRWTGPAGEATLGRVLDALPGRARAAANVNAAGRAALDAGIREGTVLPAAPGLGEGRRNGGHAGRVVAVGAHGRGTGRRARRAEHVTYRPSKEELSFVAFYADCRHEVTPVTSGYRVTLTFNLLADGEADAPEADPAADLARCLTEHFADARRATLRQPRPRSAEPARLPARPRVHPAGPELEPAQGRRRGARRRCCAPRRSGPGARRCWRSPR